VVAGNEKADEWAKLAGEEPDAHGVEWLSHADRYGRRPMPPPTSRANIRREISETKWAEAREWAEGRITARKYSLPADQRPGRAIAGSTKRLANRPVLPAEDGALPDLKWPKNQADAKCRWCPCKVQTREHLFKNCPRWKLQQKTLWAEVRRGAGWGKNRFKIRDLFTDERCTRAILDFLRVTEVGRRGKKNEIVEPVENDRREGSEVHGRQGEE